jgi:hypothetical protein
MYAEKLPYNSVFECPAEMLGDQPGDAATA